MRIVIDGTSFPCSEWREAEKPRTIQRTFADGFWGGMGASRFRNDGSYLFGHGWDVTSPPYLRLGPSLTAISTGSVQDMAGKPLYIIRGRQPNLTNVVYFFTATRVIKVNRDTNAVIYNTTRATVDYGRPALFKGSWRIPRGNTLDACTLTILDAGTEATEIHAGAQSGIKATHLCTIQDEGAAKIARSYAPSGSVASTIDLSADFITWLADFEAGDNSLPITDLLEWQGEILVIRPDGPRRFDSKGNNLPVQRYVSASLQTPAYAGANSTVVGVYGYWVDPSGIWRIAGDYVLPVGFEADPRFYITVATDLDPNASWLSAAAYGRWVYGTRGSQLWQGYIEEDGAPRWYGALFDNATNVKMRCAIDDGPTLWIVDEAAVNSRIYRIDLKADGSTRQVLGSARGSGIALEARFLLGSDDFDLPDRRKQLRRMWMLVEGLTDATDFQFRIERDGDVAGNNVGAAISSTDVTAGTGLVERATVVGTSDLFYSARFGITAEQMAGATDPRIRAWGVEVHTPSVYRAVIPLNNESVKGFSQGIPGSLKKLRQVQNAAAVTVKEPNADETEVNETFSGHVLSVMEAVKGSGWEVTVLIDRWDTPG